MSKLLNISLISGVVTLSLCLTLLYADFNRVNRIKQSKDSQNNLSATESQHQEIEDELVYDEDTVNKLYKDLEYWLKRENWKIADLITGEILLHILNRTEQGWFDIELQQQIPCKEFNKIDKLWLKYSKKRFGFTVQRQVFLKYNESLEGYNEEELKFKDWTTGHKQFATDVGWLKDEKWLKYSELAWNNLEEAPKGHLPIAARFCSFGQKPIMCWGIRTGLRFSLLSRECFIPPEKNSWMKRFWNFD
ncbi:GUN4 domain-containing protein [Limnoraphis robusta Tam1]|uniref:GUN4 domain-containing protein n=1 Tax=Limnoraphis robusta CCNP1315 TaxID=3110306 RepID=A0ABU5TRZ8_9CYAN|nr:GUN4 domain-containing protein [Limnoraphis robusta]MEA5517659.1 GUN4 domain-containing protein [Limnoraphis robusta CCNP1315]MEA5538166.1 GUN4 domain-containing protein [Limnoraphis robusta Tam1]MEA5548875.1 GUN4 domain-containing protein [Limnoraphis robusta CCNP1324]